MSFPCISGHFIQFLTKIILVHWGALWRPSTSRDVTNLPCFKGFHKAPCLGASMGFTKPVNKGSHVSEGFQEALCLKWSPYHVTDHSWSFSEPDDQLPKWHISDNNKEDAYLFRDIRTPTQPSRYSQSSVGWDWSLLWVGRPSGCVRSA